jgi:hypothetical protein
MLTLTETIDALNEERVIDTSDISTRVGNAKIWHAIVSFPGCLGDSHAIARSRDGALSSVEYWLSDDDYSARYVRGKLRRHGICYLRDGRVITLDRHTVSDCI